MDGIIGLIILAILLAVNYKFFGKVTSNLENKKMRSLIISIANFLLVLMFLFCLPLAGGYSYDNFQDVIDVFFNEETETMVIVIIIGFTAAIIYFSIGAYGTYRLKKINQEIAYCQREIYYMKNQIKDKALITNYLELLNICGGDVSSFQSYPQIKDINIITDSIYTKQNELDLLINKQSKLNNK